MERAKIMLLLLSVLPLAAVSGEKPKYADPAVPLSRDNAYFRGAEAPDYWALSPYYVAQFNGRACSVGSVSMVVNAARAGTALNAGEKLVTQERLIEKTGIEFWKKAVGPTGRGVTLGQLGRVIEKSLGGYGVDVESVDTVHMDSDSGEAAEGFKKLLVENEKSSRDFLVLNFRQGVYTGDTGGGHISPVGAYDAGSGRVLVMDVDRDWYEPYWVPVDQVIRGMATRDSESGKNRGCVHVRLSGEREE